MNRIMKANHCQERMQSKRRIAKLFKANLIPETILNSILDI